MNFLDVCTNSGILSTILFIKRLLELICIGVPIILIIMSSIEVSKIVLNPDPKVVKGVTSRVTHKMIAAVGVFFIPGIVSLLLSLIGTTNYADTACWENATNETIAAYREAERIQKEADQEKIDEERRKAEEERRRIEELREAQRQENEENAKYSELAARLIEIAQEEYNNRPKGTPNKFTRAYGAIAGYGETVYDWPWCAAFVWYCSKEAGVYPEKVTKKSAGVASYLGYFRSGENGSRYEKSAGYGGNYIPKTGDYIFFSDSHSQNSGSHIGLVKGVNDAKDKVLIIDGNCSNTICDRSLYLTDKYIIGYGVWE